MAVRLAADQASGRGRVEVSRPAVGALRVVAATSPTGLNIVALPVRISGGPMIPLRIPLCNDVQLRDIAGARPFLRHVIEESERIVGKGTRRVKREGHSRSVLADGEVCNGSGFVR